MSALNVSNERIVPSRHRSTLAMGATLEQRSGGLPPRRPTSARASIVHQKLQSALSQAEKAAELAPVESQLSFRYMKRGSEDEPQCDRAVYRYRSEAAIVSFSDPANPFTYSSNFLPGSHFYTFLASKDNSTTVSKPSLPPSVCDSQGVVVISGPTPALERGAGADAQTAAEDESKALALASTRKKVALRMWIPDTVVYGESGRAVWISSDKDGFVQRCTDFTDRLVLEKLGNPALDTERVVVVYKEAVVSTCKRPGVAPGAMCSLGNQLRLLSPGELKTLLINVTSSKKCFAVQQFVKCNGSKAFIVRAVHESAKPTSAWMISNTAPIQDANSPSPMSPTPASLSETTAGAISTPGPPITARRLSSGTGAVGTSTMNGSEASQSGQPTATSASAVIPLVNRLCTSVQVDKACTFVKLNERGCAAVSELNLRLVRYVEQKLHLQLQTLVADYMKDASGRWWLLQVKAFRVKNKLHPERPFSLPVKTRLQYLSHRDSNVLEDNSESDDEDADRGLSRGTFMAALAQRQVRKLMQCKCCLASYPKSELSFKMTLKMINETLVRIRARLAPDKSYAFLTAALSSEPPDPSLAYESWSVCSYCYAIYERDQQLKRVETKFSAVLGLPNSSTAAEGLSQAHDCTYALDPNSVGSVLPPQLTLCRLVLVFNAIYDIPKELFDAEQSYLERVPVGARKNKTLRAIASKLYLRISALGYTECVPLCTEDLLESSDKAPRGATLRKASTDMSDLQLDASEGDPNVAAGDEPPPPKNYWLPINLIRTIHFVAPRTPLQSKLKETSGITSLLNDESNIVVQFIRATEPPLKDPALPTRRTKKRRAALIPEVTTVSEMVSEMQHPRHSVLLGSTTIRLAQFRSAYVTKIDFYACMALSGEMFNLKGNIGLERLRYVDAKFLTTQYRLRMFHGVFVPDDSYMTNDPLSPEWMDSLLVSFHKQARANAGHRDVAAADKQQDASCEPSSSVVPTRRTTAQQLRLSAGSQFHRRSLASLSHTDDDEMDEELEGMIDRADIELQRVSDQSTRGDTTALQEPTLERANDDTVGVNNLQSTQASIAEMKRDLLSPTKLPSRFDHQLAMLLKKPVLTPRSAFADVDAAPGALLSRSDNGAASSDSPLSPRNTRHLWCLLVLLNEAHHLQSREHAFCRWECHYSLLAQKRSAVERQIASPASNEVHFACMHRFFVAGTTYMVQAFVRSNPVIALHLRNDMYASTRSRSSGEFACEINLLPLLQAPSFEATIDIHPVAVDDTMRMTPREAAAVARAPPFLSVAVHLTRLALDPADATATGNFLELATTSEGLQVLRKIS
ncbi:hypothetical protein PybrP1_006559 [[Pythium] brassicae (nom. inval.)]|nr:hypothetical protein PybrP1_006559 [[Pythium] brassicae (nom. inval.)]